VMIADRHRRVGPLSLERVGSGEGRVSGRLTRTLIVRAEADAEKQPILPHLPWSNSSFDAHHQLVHLQRDIYQR